MAKIGAQRAATLAGVSKATIQRAMKTGKLSYEVDEAGQKLIDTSELERVFGSRLERTNASQSEAAIQAELQRASDMLEMERVKMRVRMLEDQLHVAQNQVVDLKDQRDQWQKQAQQVMLTSQASQKQAEDLRVELQERDRKERELRQRQLELRMRRLQAQNQNEQEQEDEEPQSFWGRLFGGR
jgi:hypothetical protein